MKIGVQGFVSYKIYDNGKLVEEVKRKNLIVNSGLNAFCRVIAGELDYEIRKIGVGDSYIKPDPTQTSLLGTNTHIWNIKQKYEEQSNGFNFIWRLTEDHFNENIIREIGLFTANNILVSRIIVDKEIKKIASLSIEGKWEIYLNRIPIFPEYNPIYDMDFSTLSDDVIWNPITDANIVAEGVKSEIYQNMDAYLIKSGMLIHDETQNVVNIQIGKFGINTERKLIISFSIIENINSLLRFYTKYDTIGIEIKYDKNLILYMVTPEIGKVMIGKYYPYKNEDFILEFWSNDINYDVKLFRKVVYDQNKPLMHKTGNDFLVSSEFEMVGLILYHGFGIGLERIRLEGEPLIQSTGIEYLVDFTTKDLGSWIPTNANINNNANPEFCLYDSSSNYILDGVEIINNGNDPDPDNNNKLISTTDKEFGLKLGPFEKEEIYKTTIIINTPNTNDDAYFSLNLFTPDENLNDYFWYLNGNDNSYINAIRIYFMYDDFLEFYTDTIKGSIKDFALDSYKGDVVKNRTFKIEVWQENTLYVYLVKDENDNILYYSKHIDAFPNIDMYETEELNPKFMLFFLPKENDIAIKSIHVTKSDTFENDPNLIYYYNMYSNINSSNSSLSGINMNNIFYTYKHDDITSIGLIQKRGTNILLDDGAINTGSNILIHNESPDYDENDDFNYGIKFIHSSELNIKRLKTTIKFKEIGFEMAFIISFNENIDQTSGNYFAENTGVRLKCEKYEGNVFRKISVYSINPNESGEYYLGSLVDPPRVNPDEYIFEIWKNENKYGFKLVNPVDNNILFKRELEDLNENNYNGIAIISYRNKFSETTLPPEQDTHEIYNIEIRTDLDD